MTSRLQNRTNKILTYSTIKVFALAAVTVCVGCHEAWTKHFDTVTSARKAGMLEKGWVPQTIPEDARNIVVSGDLDSGIVTGAFTTSASHLCAPALADRKLPKYAIVLLAKSGVQASSIFDLDKQGYDAMTCPTDKVDLAYSAVTHRAYYWTNNR